MSSFKPISLFIMVGVVTWSFTYLTLNLMYYSPSGFIEKTFDKPKIGDIYYRVSGNPFDHSTVVIRDVRGTWVQYSYDDKEFVHTAAVEYLYILGYRKHR